MVSLSRDLYDIYLSFRFELTKHFKRRRLLIVGALAILIPLLFLIKAANLADQFASDSLMLMNVLVIISGAMFAGDAISSEFEKKTALLVFPTPQRRVSILVGKYLAALAATLFAPAARPLVLARWRVGFFLKVRFHLFN